MIILLTKSNCVYYFIYHLVLYFFCFAVKILFTNFCWQIIRANQKMQGFQNSRCAASVSADKSSNLILIIKIYCNSFFSETAKFLDCQGFYQHIYISLNTSSIFCSIMPISFLFASIIFSCSSISATSCFWISRGGRGIFRCLR